jgi:hypothetical protein
LEVIQDLKSAQYLGTVLADLHSVFTPHEGQVEVGRSLFYDNKTRVFVRCGRKWGKTTDEIYTLYRWALTRPNGQFYYIAPFYNQASELIWKPRFLQDFLYRPQKGIDLRAKYIATEHETDKRLTFKNGSFIKLLGSDNYESGRGLTPDGAVYDEFKDHDYRFHEGFKDNLLPKKAPLLIVGTPPETYDHFFVRTEDDFRLDPRGATFKMSTYTNPHIDKEELKLEKEAAIRKGEWAKYMREIEAEIIPGGANAIFPMFTIPRLDVKGEFDGESDHVKLAETLDERVLRHPKDYDFYCVFDPGSALVFGVLFLAVHKFTKQVIILDEIYETDRSKTSSKRIYPRAEEIMKRYNRVESWHKIYDHAATWFQVEISNEFKVSLTPCIKDVNKKEVGLSVIKDFMLDRFEDTNEPYWLVSNRCKKYIWETTNYSTDEHGKIPKANDHLQDCSRYASNSAMLSTVKRARHQRSEDRRMWTDIDYLSDDEIIEQPIDFDEDVTEEFYE